jgi:hypothetical protein
MNKKIESLELCSDAHNTKATVVIEESRVKALFDECIQVTRQTTDTKHKWYVFDNQIETAKEIIYNFYTKQNRWCLLFAEMQSGKSGTFFSIPYIISRNSVLTNKLGIGMSGDEINVYLLTGMNEKELIEQFETDISNFTGMDIKKNILHNSEMRKFLTKKKEDWSKDDELVIDRMKKNSLILIDESHYGSDKNQILNQFLTKILGISPNGDNLPLNKNNVYVVSISATPMAEFINANTSEFKKKIIPLNNAPGYYGILEMFESNKVHKSFDLKDKNSIDKFIDTILNIGKTGYILIRSTEAQKRKIYERLGERLIDFSTIDYDQYNKSRILDNMGINDILQNKPNKNTLIFLKGLLRAGKRVDTKYIIMVHDTAESKVDTTVQSLLGRCCGYNKNSSIDIYCDDVSALKYKNWVESDYDLKLVPNKSKNILGSSKVSIQTLYKPILFDVKNNSTVLTIMSKKKKTDIEKIEILKSLNDDTINQILAGELEKTYDIGSIFKVSKIKTNTSYEKQYLDVINNNTFMGDYKAEIEDLGKKIFSAAYEETEHKLVVSFGIVIENEVFVNPKSMYHETNKLKKQLIETK